MVKKTYAERKAEAQAMAIEWQLTFSDHSYSMYELMEFGEYFSNLAKRYGLIREFKENGII